MTGGAKLSVTEYRGAARHPVQWQVLGEHRRHGLIPLVVTNISAQGFMIDHGDGAERTSLERGERIMVALPNVGRIEAHLIWTTQDRAGFQFERIIRLDDFNAMIAVMLPNARLRRQK